MLILSEVLLTQSDQITTFKELKAAIQHLAIETGTIHFQVDIEPPAYNDRPDDWHDQLEIAFMSAH